MSMPHRLLFTALVALWTLALALWSAPVAAQTAATDIPAERPRNVILMIPDGFGPASVTLARQAKGSPLALDGFITGSVGTASTDSGVTDSAAGATAYASGIKTYNGAIGVDTLRQPVGTVLEGAKARGMRTGLVTTTRLTHATPAAFAAHVPSRNMEVEIAAHMMARNVDVLFGGGVEFFIPQPAGRRTDDRNLLTEAEAAGYTVVETLRGMRAVTTTPVLGVFSVSHLDYEVDRDPAAQPSLAEMTRKALELLADDAAGFFVMIEGGRIDHAGHANDPVGHLHDILAYDEAVQVTLDFARADGRTLVVSAADHETGGMSLGRDGVYAFDAGLLLQSTASAERLAALAEMLAEEREETLSLDLLEEVAVARTPLEAFTEEESVRLQAVLDNPGAWEPGQTLGRIISERALIGWTTGGHTGVDVTLHAYGPGSERLQGHLSNSEVGRIIADLLGVNLDASTARIRAEMEEEVPVAVPSGG